MLESSWVDAQLAASRKGISSVKLVSIYDYNFCTRFFITGGLFNNLNVCNYFNVRRAIYLPCISIASGYHNVFYYGTHPLTIISELFFFIWFLWVFSTGAHQIAVRKSCYDLFIYLSFSHDTKIENRFVLNSLPMSVRNSFTVREGWAVSVCGTVVTKTRNKCKLSSMETETTLRLGCTESCSVAEFHLVLVGVRSL
jgi:hypothetical protein